MYTQLILLSLLSLASANLNGWVNCGSHLATVHNVRVTGCVQTPCSFVPGTAYTIEIDATSLANSINLPFQMNVLIQGFPISFPLLEGNACTDLVAGSCPATNGAFFTWRINFPVPNLPQFPGVVTGLLWNDFGDQAVCIQVATVPTPA